MEIIKNFYNKFSFKLYRWLWQKCHVIWFQLVITFVFLLTVISQLHQWWPDAPQNEIAWILSIVYTWFVIFLVPIGVYEYFKLHNKSEYYKSKMDFYQLKMKIVELAKPSSNDALGLEFLNQNRTGNFSFERKKEKGHFERMKTQLLIQEEKNRMFQHLGKKEHITRKQSI